MMFYPIVIRFIVQFSNGRVIQGISWGDDIQWAVSTTSETPQKELVTAVFCVAITETDEIILSRSKRGWGLLGGHIELGESFEQALHRESIEEGGFTPVRPELFAVMNITPKAPILKPRSTNEYYPFPISYQLYYWSKSDIPLVPPTGIEIEESRAFDLSSVEALEITDYRLIMLGFNAYLSSRNL